MNRPHTGFVPVIFYVMGCLKPRYIIGHPVTRLKVGTSCRPGFISLPFSGQLKHVLAIMALGNAAGASFRYRPRAGHFQSNARTFFPCLTPSLTERCRSGRTGATGNRVGASSFSRVRIPPSPPSRHKLQPSDPFGRVNLGIGASLQSSPLNSRYDVSSRQQTRPSSRIDGGAADVRRDYQVVQREQRVVG